jgi:hypothetical protein
MGPNLDAGAPHKGLFSTTANVLSRKIHTIPQNFAYGFPAKFAPRIIATQKLAL